jgi:hypothetical protein
LTIISLKIFKKGKNMATLFLLLVAVCIGFFAFKVYTISEAKQLTIRQAMDEVRDDFLKRFETIKNKVVSKANKVKSPNKK